MLVPVNLSEAKSTGGQLDLIYQNRRGLSARLGVAAQRARNGQGDRLRYSPEHLLKLQLGLPIGGHLRLGLQSEFIGAQRTRDGRLGGYLLNHLTLQADRLRPGLAVTASIRNLFDRQYAWPTGDEYALSSYPGRGREFWLQTTISF
ncbi:MAG: TonB-dependent receptor [Burkholderiaceae bacterium]